MQQCLSLFAMATKIAGMASLFDLRYVTHHCFPSFYLPKVIFTSAAHIVTAIPLKPSSGILGMYPAFFLPDR
jgi:hypothetical protein